jgi:hypothetical protein
MSMQPCSSKDVAPPARDRLILRDRFLEENDDSRKHSRVFSPDDSRKQSQVFSPFTKADEDGRNRSINTWTDFAEGEEKTIQAPHEAKLAERTRTANSLKQLESNSKMIGVLFKLIGVLPSTPLWYLMLLFLVAAAPLLTPVFYFLDSRILYTPIYTAAFWPTSFVLASQLIGFRKLLATEVWRHLIINAVKHKSDSLIRKTFVRLCLFALVLFFISVIQYLVAISLGLGINVGVTKPILALASLLVFPFMLEIALIVAYIMIGLMVAADIEHVTVVVHGAFTEKRRPLTDRSFCKLVDQLRDLQCRIRVHTLEHYKRDSVTL